ncbi:hypothetical protein A3A71_01355 [Candidatus Berkelbacteria bacterium RIFCSPLOWO2_01_FULL_50_28]|uniref:Asp/Glu-ADT subunit C n=1 Tax=Candidatus Berkelbacteria bacterium RIFCSPLOWO2_01_FULL_50_28 TaxID=1797471 RepID=A0A1F5EBT7_9BACT|nr:MAG: hypothetical protein A2807_01925 [Candidatus Berkelbacteria bacterium RIFCSPHIGHO2_01_FULL_50_36]OGD64005.1 MAG: hypothetical protein A3F39_02945 [Candidatus Berkelbacteria bacterium RIFCSPHIGHO2_12_FULL_50_11]OGD64684.1 MAG: hypothetical protein A3A71_01355 [Candidatus Berkelbacteria bacterium RIFCSPLOWO2_01_FULL_50_28]
MTELSREDINHLAKLARISLSDDDHKILERDLPKIVEFVDQITRAKVDAAPTSATTRLAELRSDEPQNRTLSKEILKKTAPEFKDGFVQVPAVFTNNNE